MTFLSSGLIVVAAYLIMLAVFGYMLLTTPRDRALKPDPSLDAAPGFGLKMTGLVAAATLIGTSLVMWLDM
ncbi:hypothetical protein SAMN05421759_12040 [Roseivivax lentus]|uniref:Uncharacterized protein n=1 Tax=Roseivivax lentus TaxID=633194 RepID=A0A1N7PUJ4_9RHOB|nr:hypothetical protein [Roseivivax lentus]SIT14271.1 hypothetical protein SAMN05421759_12040 [Roseivivax lentus]